MALLDTGWRMARTAAGAFAAPPADGLDWHAAPVPGTVAQALQQAGLWSFADPQPLEGDDYWYALGFDAPRPSRLRLHGLATIAEVWLDGACLLRSDNMFLAHDIEGVAPGPHRLDLCFRSLAGALEKPLKRARWRSRLAQPAALRGIRTSLVGHMPAWCPPVAAIGPWRAVEILEESALVRADVRASLEGTAGVLEVALAFSGDGAEAAWLCCAGRRVAMEPGDAGVFAARLRIPDVELWWPHTHGTPFLYAVHAEIMQEDRLLPAKGGEEAALAKIELGRVGFRSIAPDRDADGKGFGLTVNGVPVFCRGAVWTNADIVAMPGSRDAYAPLLARMRDANMNMVRVGGAFAYETNAFFDLCDEMGILVWQDFMFANLDYPFAAPAFRASAEAEARQFLQRTRASPALAVLCGGSEVYQQAAMLGVAEADWKGEWFERDLARFVEDIRPGAIYIPNTPFGGDMPFMADAGACHYYGVSAYMRPLDDARLANVRFAAECLGFANVPDAAPAFEPGAPRLRHDCWNERVPGDVGAAWYFENVRNHYLSTLYGLSPQEALERGEDYFLALARATSAEVMESVFAEWRRAGSPTRGGLVWFLKDVWPGAGWGVIDHGGAPKSAWFALKRAFAPVQVLLIDEGLNGLKVHLINETAEEIAAELELACLADGRTPVMQASRALALAPRSVTVIPAVAFWGAFFDTGRAYRFGPPAHDVTVAALRVGGAQIAQACHFPLGRGAQLDRLGLAAVLVQVGGATFLDVSCTRFAQSVHLETCAWEPSDNWFHLAPGPARRLHLRPQARDCGPPSGVAAAVNGTDAAGFGGMA